MSNELIFCCHRLSSCIKRHLKRLVTISMTKNARRLNDELLNSSNGLLRSASSPDIASTLLMRFYPIITRCNEPLEAAHAHIDGMSCRGPPQLDLSDQLRRCTIAVEHAFGLRSTNALLFFQLHWSTKLSKVCQLNWVWEFHHQMSNELILCCHRLSSCIKRHLWPYRWRKMRDDWVMSSCIAQMDFSDQLRALGSLLQCWCASILSSQGVMSH